MYMYIYIYPIHPMYMYVCEYMQYFNRMYIHIVEHLEALFGLHKRCFTLIELSVIVICLLGLFPQTT